MGLSHHTLEAHLEQIYVILHDTDGIESVSKTIRERIILPDYTRNEGCAPCVNTGLKLTHGTGLN